MHDYLGTVKAVDESVGRVLKYLDEAGLADNTIVVYSSDQGFYLGEHGWFDKRWIFEESLRTPLLVRWPGVAKPGTVDHHLVSNLDFPETFLHAAGVSIPAEMQGKSLVPLLKGEAPADWRKSFFYQYFEYPAPHHVRPHHGVVTDRYKLVHFDINDVEEWELFDRKTDPQELKNIYKDPANTAIIAELKTELARLKSELKVPATFPNEAYGSRRPLGEAPAKKAQSKRAS
jgi:arylsulfatase A-like enzyme